MPRIIKKQEVLCFEGITISNFLNKKLLQRLKEKKLDITPISLIFIVKEKKGKDEIVYPIIVGHQNRKEVEDKILNINTPTTLTSTKFIKILEEMESK